MKTHTEEEFKKLLKNLFAEKKRVKELKKRLEGDNLQKSFQTRLADIQKLAGPDELARIKEENSIIKEQLTRVKPFLRKLAEEYKEKSGLLTKKEMEEAKREKRLAQTLEQLEIIESELEERKTQLRRLDEERHQERRSHSLAAEEWKLQQREFELLKAEFSKLQEQMTKTDSAAIHKEYAQKIAEIERQKEELLDRAYHEMKEMSRKNAKLLGESSTLEHQVEEFSEKEREFIQLKKKTAELTTGYEERGQEIKRAQTHLAKKVKETTILRDLVEKQKIQIEESNEMIMRQKKEIERLDHNLHLQRMHEEKLELIVKERAQAAESSTKEWQEKYLQAQELIAEKKRELEGYEKLKKEYTEMALTVSNLRSMLNND